MLHANDWSKYKLTYFHIFQKITEAAVCYFYYLSKRLHLPSSLVN